MISAFTFAAMPRLIAGPGTIGRLGKLAAPFGRNALLVTGSKALERSGHLSPILEDLKSEGMHVFRYRIAGEPSPVMVDQAVSDFKRKAVDVVLAVGGGSVLDAGKAIAAMLKENGSVVDFLEGVGNRTPSGQSVPVVAVPTTSGTGSEATKNAVISRVGSGGFKKSLRHDNYIPRLAILDPTLCTSAPASVTAACGMDALTQLIESYVSTHASPLTDIMAIDGMRYLIPELPDACGKGASDLGCRGAVAYGAFLSGVTLANAGLGVVHGVAGPLGGLLSIPHGVACANLLPFAVRATVDNLSGINTAPSNAAIDKFARIGRLFGAKPDNRLGGCLHLVDCLYQWLDQLDIPRLGRFGLTAAHVDFLVRAASNKNNPWPLSDSQIGQMIQDRC
ncbi:iron-containing alcohol dehydrogenase [uncultured Desulfosarcina sp.]|uniref:iron-containing alcohol dehydrogenase n=1 Tax=uncultured Desulfosarcina sp. TaxID=218289 RepID=UPI0029C68755|nr:iron-containing alcohol dehydrogenase [uncultured Desulfosarcina sp.]